ncbi:MAG: metal-sensing transcriptional repressor [Erysipelotrichaceae bacterium]|nr:metal-sensing transcriptional repressor [Erysipelotrichaceae bacterium]
MECCKKKHRSEEEYKDLINRLKRIEGQVRGIEKMVEEDAYCVDILTQVTAVRSALASFDKVLLSSHIRTCVKDGLASGDDSVIEELTDVVGKMMR